MLSNKFISITVLTKYKEYKIYDLVKRFKIKKNKLYIYSYANNTKTVTVFNITYIVGFSVYFKK